MIQKKWKFFKQNKTKQKKKKEKIAKQAHAFKGYASSYNVEI